MVIGDWAEERRREAEREIKKAKKEKKNEEKGIGIFKGLVQVCTKTRIGFVLCRFGVSDRSRKSFTLPMLNRLDFGFFGPRVLRVE